MSEKRMVSSVFITLAPPWRGPSTLQENTRKVPEAGLGQTAESTKLIEANRWESSTQPPPKALANGNRSAKRSERARDVVESWLEESNFSNGDSSSLPPPFLEDLSPVKDLRKPDLPLPPAPPQAIPVPSPSSLILPPQTAPPHHGRPVPPSLSLGDIHGSHLQKPDPTPSPGLQVISPLLEEYTLIQPAPVSYTMADEPQPPRKSVNGYRDDGAAEVCAFCRKSISSQAAVVEAMRKQYHARCFTCRKCQSELAGQRYYQVDGQPLCDSCYKDTLDKCAKCQAAIMDHIVRAMGSGYHPECFSCVVCHRRIADESFAVDDHNEIHCADDYYRKYAPVCSVCNNPIIPKDGRDSYKIECLGRNFHEDCYRCEKCRIPLSVEPTDRGCFPLENRILCKTCHLSWDRESSC